jgi:prepilin-type processing-associated H-X9-DG protein
VTASQAPEIAPLFARVPPVATGRTFPTPPGGNMNVPAPEFAPVKKGGGMLVPLLIIGGVLALSCVIIVPLMAGIMLPALGKARSSARQIKDSTQIRGVHQGMMLWAQNNADLYPIPSLIDKDNTTLAAGDVKDLPRHITSVLIYNGFFSPELTISPAESNGMLAVDVAYMYSGPMGTANADANLALWDPGFKAVPEDTGAYGRSRPGTPGNLSYAYMPFVGARKAKWSNTFQATEAIVGNRGPAYVTAGTGAGLTWQLVAGWSTGGGNTPVGTGSNSLLIHGGRTTWEGNIVFNDGHVSFETAPDPASTPFTFTGLAAGQRTQSDNLFVNENDTTRVPDGTNGITGPGLANTNNFLRTWTGGLNNPETGEIADIPSELWFD